MTTPTPWPAGVTVREQEPLARHSPWRVGGPCDAWVVVHTPGALGPTLTLLRDRGWSRTLLGAGTRTIFRDNGVAGAVVRLGASFCSVEASPGELRVGGATPLAIVASRVAQASWRRLLNAPGSVAASVLNDPGWEPWVVSVTAHTRGHDRDIGLDELRAKPGNAVVTSVLIRTYADAAPPLSGHGKANPPTPVSGWFVVEKGSELRGVLVRANIGGVRLRDVAIPEVAPEELVNLGQTTARELALLQRSVIDRVHQVTGVEITDRMRWIGRQG